MPNISISNVHELATARKFGFEFQEFRNGGGIITFNGRTYQVNANNTVTRKFDGICSRVASAVTDLFTRGSVTTRAKSLENIMFGKRSVPVPVKIKNEKD